MHRAISMYYPVQCFSLPLWCCQADFPKCTEESLGADPFPSLENGDAAAMVHARYVVLLYQIPVLYPKCASGSRRTRHLKCCGTDGTSAALQPTQVRNCVSSRGAQRNIHLHKHRWLLGSETMNYPSYFLEVNPEATLRGTPSLCWSKHSPIILALLFLKQHGPVYSAESTELNAWGDSSHSLPGTHLHRLHFLKIIFPQRALWWKWPLDDSHSNVLLRLHQISQDSTQLRMLPREKLTVQRRFTLLSAERVGFELAWRMVPGLGGCGQGSADLELSSESCQQYPNCSALPAHFPTQPGSLWNHSDGFLWLKYF